MAFAKIIQCLKKEYEVGDAYEIINRVMTIKTI